MRRREFIAGAGGAAILWPALARAQRDAVPIVGVARSSAAEGFDNLVVAIREGLKERGFVDGENVRLETRWAGDDAARIPQVFRELLDLRASVIVANNVAIMSGRTVIGTTPVVFVSGNDPVKGGIVTNLSRPGGTMTGVSFYAVPLSAKRLGLLADLVPGAASIAVLVDPSFAPSADELAALEAAAPKLGRKLAVFKATNAQETEEAFAAIAQSGAGGLHVGNGPFFNGHRLRILALAAERKIPASYWLRSFTDAGGLMSYGASQVDAYRRAGVYAARILRGEKPGDLPVELPTRFELLINLKTAKELGITVPNAFTLLADEVIE